MMAHLGCFVPASYACFRLTDRVCTRLGSGDDMEANASTFLKEVRLQGPRCVVHSVLAECALSSYIASYC